MVPDGQVHTRRVDGAAAYETTKRRLRRRPPCHRQPLAGSAPLACSGGGFLAGLTRSLRCAGRRLTFVTETSDQVVDEMRAFVEDLTAATCFALVAVRQYRVETEVMKLLPENPDPQVGIGSGPPGVVPPIVVSRRSKVLEQLAVGGPVERNLSQQWVVSLYTAWDHEYRTRLADALGVTKDAVVDDLLGDLRRVRHDIVHHHGVATKANSGRCLMLDIPVNVPIVLDADVLAAIRDAFDWDAMAKAKR